MYTFIHDILCSFSCVELSFFYIFTSDVTCLESFDRRKSNGFNISPSFSLWGEGEDMTVAEWRTIHFIKQINHGHSSEELYEI